MGMRHLLYCRYCLQLEPGTGLLPPVLPPETLRTLQQYLMGLNKWAFMGEREALLA